MTISKTIVESIINYSGTPGVSMMVISRWIIPDSSLKHNNEYVKVALVIECQFVRASYLLAYTQVIC